MIFTSEWGTKHALCYSVVSLPVWKFYFNFVTCLCIVKVSPLCWMHLLVSDFIFTRFLPVERPTLRSLAWLSKIQQNFSVFMIGLLPQQVHASQLEHRSKWSIVQTLGKVGLPLHLVALGAKSKPWIREQSPKSSGAWMTFQLEMHRWMTFYCFSDNCLTRKQDFQLDVSHDSS